MVKRAQGLLTSSKKMHKTAMVGKKHGAAMYEGAKSGAHQKPPMSKKSNKERRGTAKSQGAKMTAL